MKKLTKVHTPTSIVFNFAALFAWLNGTEHFAIVLFIFALASMNIKEEDA